MSQAPQFSLKKLGGRPSRTTDLATILEDLPQAILLVDIQKEKILACSQLAAELCLRNRVDLAALNISEVLPDWKAHLRSALDINTPEIITVINRSDATRLPVSIQLKCLPENRTQALIFLDAPQNLDRQTHNQEKIEPLCSLQPWQALNKLATAYQRSELIEALQAVLQAGQELVPTDLLAIYTAEIISAPGVSSPGEQRQGVSSPKQRSLLPGSSPGLQRLAMLGDSAKFPTELPIKDLAAIRTPHLWAPGIRPLVTLHRIARQLGFRYLATAPLDQANSTVGLLVLANTKPAKLQSTSEDLPSEAQILSTISLLSAQITALLQLHSQRAAIRTQAQDQIHRLSLTEQIHDQIREGLIILTPDLKITSINQAAVSILGYNRREAVGLSIERILIGSEEIIAALNGLKAEHGAVFFTASVSSPTETHQDLHPLHTLNFDNLHLYRRNGDSFLAKVRLLPMTDPDTYQGISKQERLQSQELPFRITLLIQDLTDLEQIQEQAQKLEQRAILGDIIAVFAHEVRNPINNINSGLELLAYNLALPGQKSGEQSTSSPDPNQETIQRLLHDCDRLDELMKSILSYSKPSEYLMEKLDLGLLIQRLLASIHSRLSRVHVEHTLQIEPGLPPILGNTRALEQVFTNLINNAVQAMGEAGGQLAVKVQHLPASEGKVGAGYLQASIADNGPGIPPEIQDRLFQPFFTTHRDGTGLGLPLARRIVTAHRGSIRLESFPGGTVFHIQLPIAGATSETDKPVFMSGSEAR